MPRFSRALVVLVCSTGATASLEAQAVPDLAFMSGCWQGTFESRGRSGTIEEHYTSPSANLILGTTRYMIEGRTVMFELTSILLADSTVTLTPYPRGNRSEHGFELTAVVADSAVFEAPEHDFPKRIIYRLRHGQLLARIDDATLTGPSQSWQMNRCQQAAD